MTWFPVEPSIQLISGQRVHFIGIGGVGMCGLAEILHKTGYVVTGSDISASPRVEKLKNLGIPITLDQKAGQLPKTDVVVYSSIIRPENPEYQAAQLAGIPLLSRGALLALLFNAQFGIAGAGSHGKTTTSGAISELLVKGGCDPTFMVGGCIQSLNCYARVGDGRYFVAESDESDASFLYLRPAVGIVTNIDRDHLGTYGNDFTQLILAFQQFVDHSQKVIVCWDDPVIRSLSLAPEKTITYGFHPEADFRISDFQQIGLQSEFWVYRAGKKQKYRINLPGQHSALNMTAVIAVAEMLGIDQAVISEFLINFRGMGRRFHVHGERRLAGKRVLLVDDYGHHPKEVGVTLTAAQAAWPDRRVVLVYQPHRYSRTLSLRSEFADVLSQASRLILLPVYSAWEEWQEGGDTPALLAEILKRVPDLEVDMIELSRAVEQLGERVQEGDVLFLQGAGNIHSVVEALLKTADET